MMDKLKIVGITFVALALVAGALIGGSIVLGQNSDTSVVDAETAAFAAEITGFENQAAIGQEAPAEVPENAPANAQANAPADASNTQAEAPAEQSEGKRGGDGEDRNSWAEAYKDDIKSDIAAVLGLTTEELDAAKEAGTSMEDLIAAAGLTEDELHAAVNEIKIGYVNQAVADGVLTQEQADEIIAKIESGEGRGGRGGKGDGNRGDGEGRPEGPPPQDG